MFARTEFSKSDRLLAAAVIKDARFNTATQTIVVDTLGLSAAQVSRLKTMIESGLAGATKRIEYLK